MFLKYITVLLKVLAIQLCILKYVLAADSTDISRLRAKILENYDVHTRPVLNHSDTTLVTIRFLNNGFEVDERRNMMTLHLLSVLSWVDEHVTWDPLNYANLTELPFGAMDLWKPEINVMNNFDESEIDHFGNTLIISVSDSWIWWIPPCKFQVHCDFNFQLWPYDRQTCKVILSSWTYHGAEVNLVLSENHTELAFDEEWQEKYRENREWDLLGSSVRRYSQVVYCCPKIPVVQLSITVNIQRKYTTHTAALTVVGLGIATAILVGFWLDPFAQERLPLTLLVLLLNSIYLQYLHKVIPNNGSSVPLSICFFRDSLIMITFAFAWTVGIRYLAKIKYSSPIALPDFILSFLDSFAAKVLCLNPRPQCKGQAQRKLKENAEGNDDGDVSELVGIESSDIPENWEWLARFLDRIAFFAYLITYTIFISAFL